MFYVVRLKKLIMAFVSLVLSITLVCSVVYAVQSHALESSLYVSDGDKKSYIKWVDFDIPSSLMKETMKLDIDSYNNPGETRMNWIELLANLATKYGGDFSKYKSADLTKLVETLRGGETMQDLVKEKKYYPYYLEAYTAVLGGFVGEYEIETEKDKWESKYGLKVFSPIAKNYSYTDSDDFGNGRSYGYNRKHLGHDFMANIGTPVIAVESGVIEVLGWNQYGGWRIGMRSFDGTRYYYYGHLRQNRPYADGLEAGQVIMAGDVIGYVGRTGYSAKENTNGVKENHLHMGLQLIFDESQKEGVNQIWIDLYDITRLLSSNRSETIRDDETKEYDRKVGYREVIPENRFEPTAEDAPADPGDGGTIADQLDTSEGSTQSVS